jgi:hypothetical protein
MIEDFHKPFIKSLVIVAIVTLFALVSSKYIVNYYINTDYLPPETTQKQLESSKEQSYSSFVE